MVLAGWLELDTVLVTLLRLAGAPDEAAADTAPPSEKPLDEVVVEPPIPKAGAAELLAEIPPKERPVELVVVVPPSENPPTLAVLVPPREKPVEAVVAAAAVVPPNENPVEAAGVANENPVAGTEVVAETPNVSPPAGAMLVAAPPREKPPPAAGAAPSPKAVDLAGAAPPRDRLVGATAATVAIGVPKVRLPPVLAPNPPKAGVEEAVGATAPKAGGAVVLA